MQRDGSSVRCIQGDGLNVKWIESSDASGASPGYTSSVRVLLIHPCDFPDPRRPAPLLPPNQAPPLGLAYIGGFLRDAGHEVAIHDMRHSPLDRDAFMDVVRNFS